MSDLNGGGRRRVGICAVVVLALVAACAAYALAARHEAQGYDRSVESAAEATDGLNRAVAAAQRVLDGYEAAQLNDPETLTRLDQTLVQAKTLTAPNAEPDRWLIWKTNAARADNERYASDAARMAALVERAADDVTGSFEARRQETGKTEGSAAEETGKADGAGRIDSAISA